MVDENFTLNSQLEFKHLDCETVVKAYVSKHVRRLGFGLRANQIDSEYERIRSWSLGLILENTLPRY